MLPKINTNLICTKLLTEMLSYVKIEVDGTEVKNNLLSPNIQQCIRVVDNTYKIAEKQTKIETEFEIRMKNKEGKKIFCCLLKEIYKIVDKQTQEGYSVWHQRKAR